MREAIRQSDVKWQSRHVQVFSVISEPKKEPKKDRGLTKERLEVQQLEYTWKEAKSGGQVHLELRLKSLNEEQRPTPPDPSDLQIGD